MSDSQINNGEYFRSYNLERDPFPVHEVDSVYYATPELEHRLELVKHLVDFSDRVLLITGDHGSGKSAFLQRLEAEVDERWRITRLDFNGSETPETVLARIFDQSHLDYPGGDTVNYYVNTLGRHFQNNINNNLVNVFLVDNAHLATAGVLNLLLQLARPQPDSVQVHLVMVSAEDISTVIGNQDNDFVHKMDLPLLSEDQIPGYLQHRLDAVEFEQKELFFSEQHYKQIYKTSGGNPALVNQLAARILQEPSRVVSKKQKQSTSPLLALMFNGRVTLIVSLVLAAVFVVIILNKEAAEDPQTISLTLPGKPADKPVVGERTDAETPVPAVPLATTTAPQEVPATEEMAAEPSHIKEAIPEAPVSFEEAEATEPVLSEPDTEEITSAPKTVPATAEESVAEEPTLVIHQTEPEPEPVKVILPEKQPAPEPAPSGESVGLKDSAWLNQQVPEKYVLQIMGAHDPDVLTKLLSANPSIFNQVARFTTVNNNKRWHVLVYGLYANRDAAVADIDQLPKKIRALGPWPRSIASIQKDLR